MFLTHVRLLAALGYTSEVAADGSEKTFQAISRIDTPEEMSYYRHGGILPYVLRQLIGR